MADKNEKISEALDNLVNSTNKLEIKDYKFWNTQPVPRLENAEIEPDTPHDQIRKEPINLPASFEWCELDLTSDEHVKELYELLRDNYVEDTQSSFRFEYSAEMIRWALMPPGYKKEWHIGVRVQNTKKLVAFIGGTPLDLQIYEKNKKMVEINFLCVHKKLRAKRLAPVLIMEVTRKVHLFGIFQAVYTAGAKLPKPISSCLYFHRSINPKKLIEIGFSALKRNMTMSATIKLFKLPEKPLTFGFRQATLQDLDGIHSLLSEEMKRYSVHQCFTKEEIKHYFLYSDPVHSFVVETERKLTAFVSFYTLSNSILNNSKHTNMKAAYLWYYAAPNDGVLRNIVNDVLIIARDMQHDVFNCLELMRNKSFINDLKFAAGDGTLNFYLYNWKCPAVDNDKQAFLVI